MLQSHPHVTPVASPAAVRCAVLSSCSGVPCRHPPPPPPCCYVIFLHCRVPFFAPAFPCGLHKISPSVNPACAGCVAPAVAPPKRRVQGTLGENRCLHIFLSSEIKRQLRAGGSPGARHRWRTAAPLQREGETPVCQNAGSLKRGKNLGSSVSRPVPSVSPCTSTRVLCSWTSFLPCVCTAPSTVEARGLRRYGHMDK